MGMWVCAVRPAGLYAVPVAAYPGPRETVVAIRPLGADGPEFIAWQASREFWEDGVAPSGAPFEADEDRARRMAAEEFFVQRLCRDGGASGDRHVGVFHCRADGRAFAGSPDPVRIDARRTALVRAGAAIPGLEKAFASTEDAVRDEGK